MKRAIAAIAVVVVLVGIHDGVAPRERELTTSLAVFAIGQYRAHVSPRIGAIIECRFEPTCSEYGLESVKKHGAIVGGARALWRIARCNPLTPQGTVDPP